ncbi:TraB/TrbI/VirB10 family type IV secretion system protein [Govanella unica]|uniref:TrbI/VirB10 family protein n=1 Tax=Govanella unica TaxID=2975056 RepID=A0A9X3TXD4_9PROT|nr:TrbI/VirB10 family protein [Govania unica]MDA5193716.1 TrbI/VirB10 family protein [Govania unica]
MTGSRDDQIKMDLPEPGPKEDPEGLALRVKPRRITRINRKVLLVLCALGLLILFGAAILALQPPKLMERPATSPELHNLSSKAKPEGLEVLPRRYSDKPRIQLGAPLPGDLGSPVLQTEANLGLGSPATSDMEFRPNAEDDAQRAERIRLARLDAQARESDVLFQLRAKAGAGGTPASAAERPTTIRSDQMGILGPQAVADASEDQNGQKRKLGFLDSKVDDTIYSAHALQDPVSPYQIMAGTVIAASLLTGINSDLPGRVIAQVTENIYDSVSGRYLLLPQGSRLIGSYDSMVAFGQSRALIIWQRIILPDGSSTVIDNLPATDLAGYAGLEDAVDYHTWRLIKGVALSTLLGVGTELTFGGNESDLVTALRQSTQDNVNRAGQRITERNLNIQPTITIRPGWPLRVIVHKDMVLRPYRG